MARQRNPDARKKLLCIGKTVPKGLSELLALRGDSTVYSEEFDAFDDPERSIKIMKKKQSALVISTSGDRLSMGRSYDGEFLDLFKFRIVRMAHSGEFPGVAPEPFVKYFVLLQGVRDSRMENFVLDLLRQRSTSVDLRGIRYAWIFSQKERVYTLRYVRVHDGLGVEDIGPYLELQLEGQYACGDELWTKALDKRKPKKIRNTSKNAFKDTIGKVYIDRQDLRDIKLKRRKTHKQAE